MQSYRDLFLGVVFWFQSIRSVVLSAPMRIGGVIFGIAISVSALLGVGLAATAAIHSFAGAIESSADPAVDMQSARWLVRCAAPNGCPDGIPSQARAAFGELGSISAYHETMVALERSSTPDDVLELPLVVTDLGSLALDTVDQLVVTDSLRSALAPAFVGHPSIFVDQSEVSFSAVRFVPEKDLPAELRQYGAVLLADLNHPGLRSSLRGAMVIAPFWGVTETALREEASRYALDLEAVGSARKGPEESGKMLGAFILNVTVMVLLTVVVAVAFLFLASQRMVEERRHDCLVLRVLGATPHLLVGFLFTEVLVWASVGTMLAVTLGSPLISLLAGTVLESTSTLFLGGRQGILPDFSSIPVVASALIVAVLVSAAGAILPIARIVRGGVRRVERGGSSLQEEAARPVSPFVFLLTLVAAGCVGGALLFSSLSLALVGTVSTIGLIGALGIFLARRLLRSRVFLGSRPESSLAAMRQAFSQQGIVVLQRSALIGCLALTLVFSLAAMVDSFRSRLQVWADQSVKADIVVRSLLQGALAQRPVLPRSLLVELQQIPGVACLEWRSVPSTVTLADGVVLSAVVESRPCLESAHGFTGRRATQEGEVVANEAAQRLLNLQIGETRLIGGTPFVVVGVRQDFNPEGPQLLFPEFQTHQLEALRSLPGQIASIAVFAESPAVRDQVVSSVRQRTKGVGLSATGSALKVLMLETFDQTFLITKFMRWCVVLLALIALSVLWGQWLHELARERGLLRLLGVNQGELFFALLAPVGAIAAIVVGIGLMGGYLGAWLLTHLINPLSFGWTFPLVYNTGEFITLALGLVLLAGVSAAIGRSSRRPDGRIAESLT